MPEIHALSTDVLIMGAGGAGLRAAVEARGLGAQTVLISKSIFPGGSSVVAGGFLQASFHPEDSPDLHFRDTVIGGSFLNNQRLVRILAEEGPQRVMDLERFGLVLYRKEDGSISVRSFGGSSKPRGVEAGISAYAQRRLCEEALRRGAEVWDEVMVTKLLTNSYGTVVGATAIDTRNGDLLVIAARSTVLAAGALGRLYKITADTRSATGDGFALARKIGTKMVNMEMLQFIPLAYCYPQFVKGCTLGEAGNFGKGIIFYNKDGERYLLKYDPRGEFATRDIVARGNFIEIKEGRGSPHDGIWVDASKVDPSHLAYAPHLLKERWKMLRDYYGEDAANCKVPFEATPAALFMVGGVEIDEHCHTSTEGLLACGEQAANIHGANRLGGNALIELQVFGKRAGESAANRAREIPMPRLSIQDPQVAEERDRVYGLLNRSDGLRPFQAKKKLQEVMWDKVGVLRDGEMLQEAIEEILRMKKEDLPRIAVASNTLRYNYDWIEALELANMLEVAEMMAGSALVRQESRGAHYRHDFPKRDDANWLVETTVKEVDGVLRLGTQPANLTEMRPE